MAGTGQPVDQFFNEPAIDAQIKRILAQVGLVADALLEVQKLAENTKGVQGMANISMAIDAMAAASANAEKSTLKLKSQEEELTVTITKAAAAKQENNRQMSETEKLMKMYETGMAKLNATLSTEAELAAQAKVANAEVAKQLKEQAKQALGLVGAYELLEAEYKDLKTKAQDMAAIWGVQSKQAKEAAASALEVHNKLSAIDQSMGNFKRNVGNYASGFQNFNQILRETPNFAISATIGLQSLSNNIPMFVDDIKKARAAGMSWNDVLKTLSASIFSLGGLVVLATVALTAVPKLFQAMASEADKLERKFKSFSEVQAEATRNVIKDRVELDAYLLVARDVTQTTEKRSAAVRKINDIMPDYLGKITLEGINTKETDDKIKAYINTLSKKALAQAYITKIQDLYAKAITIENEAIGENIKWYQQLWLVIKNGGNPAQMNIDFLQKDSEERIKNITNVKKEIAALQEDFKTKLMNGEAELDLDKKMADGKVKHKKEASDRTLVIAQDELKAAFEADKALIEQNKAMFKAISENDDLSYNDRVVAAARYYDEQQRLIERQRKYELDSMDLKARELDRKQKAINADKNLSPAAKQIESGNIAAELKAVNAQKLAIEAEYHKASVTAELDYAKNIEKLTDELNKHIADTDKKAQADKIKSREDDLKSMEADIVSAQLESQNKLNAALIQLNQDFLNGKIKSVEDYERRKQAIEFQYIKEGVAAQIKATEFLLDNAALDAKTEAKYREDLQKLKLRLTQLDLDNSKKLSKAVTKDLLDSLREIQTAVSNVSQAISEVASLGFEQRQADLETERNNIEKNAEAELKKIQSSTMSQQEQTNETIMLEARKQAQIEENDRKRRKLDTDRAKFERMNSIAGIITGTSLAVVGALKNPGGFAGLALAFTFGALGLAQLTKALAAPIPKYKHGTGFHKGGIAEVGDGGKAERVILPSGEQFDTPATSTYMDLPRGTRVLPDADQVNKAMMGRMVRRTAQQVQDRNDNRDLVNWQTQTLLKGMAKNKPRVVNKNVVSFGRDFYLLKQVYE